MQQAEACELVAQRARLYFWRWLTLCVSLGAVLLLISNWLQVSNELQYVNSVRKTLALSISSNFEASSSDLKTSNDSSNLTELSDQATNKSSVELKEAKFPFERLVGEFDSVAGEF